MRFFVIAAGISMLAAGAAQAQTGCRYERTTHHTVCNGPTATASRPVMATNTGHGTYDTALRNRNGSAQPVAAAPVGPMRRAPGPHPTKTCVKNDLLAVNSCR